MKKMCPTISLFSSTKNNGHKRKTIDIQTGSMCLLYSADSLDWPACLCTSNWTTDGCKKYSFVYYTKSSGLCFSKWTWSTWLPWGDHVLKGQGRSQVDHLVHDCFGLFFLSKTQPFVVFLFRLVPLLLYLIHFLQWKNTGAKKWRLLGRFLLLHQWHRCAWVQTIYGPPSGERSSPF